MAPVCRAGSQHGQLALVLHMGLDGGQAQAQLRQQLRGVAGAGGEPGRPRVAEQGHQQQRAGVVQRQVHLKAPAELQSWTKAMRELCWDWSGSACGGLCLRGVMDTAPACRTCD